VDDSSSSHCIAYVVSHHYQQDSRKRGFIRTNKWHSDVLSESLYLLSAGKQSGIPIVCCDTKLDKYVEEQTLQFE
jgi:hypothetical protein